MSLLFLKNRSRQFNEAARGQQMSKALPDDQASVSGSEMGLDEESKETVSNLPWRFLI